MWLCRANCWRYKHWWFSGRILACHAGDRGSIPRQCNLCFLHECNILYVIVQGTLTTLQALVVQWTNSRLPRGWPGFVSPPMKLFFLTWMQYFICDCAGYIVDVTSIGGSVVEFSPAMRETGVRFHANATFVCNMNAIFYVIVQGKLATIQALVVQW